MADEIKLLGVWASPFSRRIELVLKLKGLQFEYSEEDLSNKSDLLLKSNPVHKKIPVFFHNGKPISESLLIIEYIDETWGNDYSILPTDPYDRAIARFWAKFVDDKVLPTAFKAVVGKDKEREDALEEFSQQITFLEGELKGKEYFGGERIGFVDIAAFFILHWIDVMQEVTETDVITKVKFPLIVEWMEKLRDNNVVLGCLPEREKHLDYVRARRAAAEEAAAKGEEEEVKLLGTWSSPYRARVELALRLKSIPFQFIEEDLSNKSPLLLHSNPIHKKIPVLIHNGNPISESLIILEYINETWNNNGNPLLPRDPHARSAARFWMKFVDETILPTSAKSTKTRDRGELEKIMEEVNQQLKLLEKELDGKEYFGGETIGMLDVVVLMTVYWFELIQECMGVVEPSLQLITEEKIPGLVKWMRKLLTVDAVKETLPPREKQIARIRALVGAENSAN
ncbi:Glutathione S-transferase U7 [Linum perenne]